MAIYDFEMEPFSDFSKKENIKKYHEGLKTVEGYLGKEYPLIIDGKRVTTGNLYTSMNPADHDEVIGTLHQAGVEEVELAMQKALDAFETWKKTPAKVRADVLFKAAAIVRRRKFEFSALMTKEAGKPYKEADADTAEAIDFMEYYARQMLELEEVDKKVLSRKNIERNEFKYIPMGVGAVITPWNFPMAIMTGMTTSAIVSGNTILLKPANTTQIIAYKLVEALEEAGLPKGVVNFVPGKGSEIGNYIVKHPKTSFISFTGSKAVGETIYEEAAKVRKGQTHLKRVIAEMGGKDAVVVDEGYDPKEAAEILKTSAFGFSGQKCSAASRGIIHESIYDKVLDELKEQCKDIIVADPADEDTFMGPVNDRNAFEKIKAYIEVGKEEGTLLIGGNAEDKNGWFIEPTVFYDVDPKARLMQEEIFGPVLALTKFKDFKEAIDIANDTEYGLTGALLTHSREHMEYARENFHVGNLYFNRKCTGAIVGYQPFGGFKMSGTDSKAGGPDYLKLFMLGKTITEAL
ncbi:MAG: L-glutamate gamma-semialdehyde dehydrogenase [Candidatus Izemoplasmataceae bacterium]